VLKSELCVLRFPEKKQKNIFFVWLEVKRGLDVNVVCFGENFM
jgi:hypothetical protein